MRLTRLQSLNINFESSTCLVSATLKISIESLAVINAWHLQDFQDWDGGKESRLKLAAITAYFKILWQTLLESFWFRLGVCDSRQKKQSSEKSCWTSKIWLTEYTTALGCDVKWYQISNTRFNKMAIVPPKSSKQSQCVQSFALPRTHSVQALVNEQAGFRNEAGLSDMTVFRSMII